MRNSIVSVREVQGDAHSVHRERFRDATSRSTRETPSVRLEPSRGWGALNLGAVWARRELAYLLIWRDIRDRYKQTLLGASWAVLQPLLTMTVFSLFFGRLARIPSHGLPYALFAYTALVPWIFFANGMGQAANSLVLNTQLLTKVYFPRLIIPAATVLAGLLDFVLAFLVLIGMMAYFGIPPTITILFVPLLLLLAIVSALGAGLWLAALNVQFRDVRHTMPFLTQFWMFATPIAYPSSLLPEHWRIIYGLNPMVGVVEGFRWALLGVNTTPPAVFIVSTVVAVALLVTGAFYFRRMERAFADVV